MRALSALVASLVVFGALAGCIGGDDKTEPPAGPGTAPGATTGGTTNPGTAPQLTVLAPLASMVTIEGPQWVASGTEVPVKAMAPTNAKGTVTYAWALGPLPGTTTVVASPADTGSAKDASNWIQPGNSKPLTYSKAGVYSMHCHPHPAMRHNVTVIDGYSGPKAFEVFITDGEKQNEYRFVPENIVVPTGAVVTYKNVGQQPHTATALGAQEPALKMLPLKAATGNLKIEGEGWQRVVVIATDSEGRLGIAQKEIYTTAKLPAFETQTIPMTFEYGTPTAIGAAPVAAAAKTAPVQLEQPGLVTINYTFQDGASAAGGPENLAEVEVHFTKDGETQDTFTAPPSDAGSIGGKAIAGAYTLRVVPLQGARVSGTIIIEVAYELVPPPPAKPGAPADDGHGGHAH